ncbi:MAG TPA: FxDxF family PEP-CTERM protein [Steroidobacteraceae bacterium]|nr:FxDxF family PEP-CTERM protein [Steroidobacteraceae bacterium]
MTTKNSTLAVQGRRLLGALLCVAFAPPAALAATVPLNGSGAMSYSFQFLGTSPGTPTIGSDYLLAVPGQYTFTDTFTSKQTTTLGSSPVGSYDFQDSYRFTVASGANGDTLVAQLGLPPTFNVANLQFRLYDVTAASSQTPVVGGVPPGSVLLTAWMGPQSGQNSVSASFSGIRAGDTYLLDVAGIANGDSGGTYIGQLNLAPVPLPAAAWLLASALGLVGVASRHRSGRGAATDD